MAEKKGVFVDAAEIPGVVVLDGKACPEEGTVGTTRLKRVSLGI